MNPSGGPDGVALPTTRSGGFSPTFFPPAGVSVAAMLLNPRSRWPAIVLAVVAAEFAVDAYFGEGWRVIAGFAAANAVEPLIGASLVLALCGGPPDLRRRRDLLVFLGAACLVAPAVAGLIGGATKALKDAAPLWDNALRWWGGDALGVLVVAVPILLWPKQKEILKAHPIETASILFGTAALAYVGFRTQFQPSMLVLPALAVAALRLDMLGAALASAATAVAANLTTQGVVSELAGEHLGPTTSLALAQARIAVWAVLALVIAQEASGRLIAGASTRPSDVSDFG